MQGFCGLTAVAYAYLSFALIKLDPLAQFLDKHAFLAAWYNLHATFSIITTPKVIHGQVVFIQLGSGHSQLK